MGLFKFFKNLNLSIKLNLVVSVVLGILLVALVVATNNSIGNQTINTGRQRAEQEVAVVQSRFAEAERGLLADTKLLANSAGLVEALEDGDAARVKTILLASGAPLDLDNKDVVDANGARIATVPEDESAVPDDEQQDSLLSLALLGIESTGTLLAEDEAGPEFRLAAVVPLRDTSGTIVGGLLASRDVDDAFLANINFSREDIGLILITEGQVVAQDVIGDPEASSAIVLDRAAVSQALNGQPLIADRLVSVDSTPHALAYTPLTVGRETSAVVGILIDLSELSALQNRLSSNLTAIFALLSLVAVGVVALFARQSVAAPLRKLQSVAERMAGGNYWQRAQADTTDEVGQLAGAFNKMANAVQSRETELQNLTDSLEQQVDERTADLRQQAENLLTANRELAVARQKAEDADKIKSEFLATMSHELRTPLNAIIGYSQMILAGMAGEIDSQQRDYQERIFANGKNLLDLINDILDLAKIEAGRMDMVKKPLVLRDWLDEVVHQTQALADAKGLKFESELDRRMPDIIVGDPGRLKQIAFNLLSNAVKFTEKGHVKLSIRRQGQATWTLVVIDTGIGIPSHAQEYIFDEFRQVDGTSRREYGGSGLGLAVVRNLALMMGGNVRVSSRVQEGSTFTVLLPLITEEMLSRDEKHPEIQKV